MRNSAILLFTILSLPLLRGQGRLSIPEGHSAPVNAVCFSPDGRELLTASRDHTLKIWDTRTGLQKRPLQGHESWVLNALYSPDGQYILSSGKDFTLRLWEPATGRLLGTFEQANSLVLDMVFLGRHRVFLGCMDGRVLLLDILSGQILSSLGPMPAPVSALALSGGRRLLAGGWDGSLWAWDLNTLRPERQSRPFPHEVTAIAAGPDGLFYTADTTGMIYGWEGAAERPLWARQAHEGATTALQLNPALPGHLASAGEDGQLRIWQCEGAAGPELLNMAGHSNWLSGLSYSPDGRLLAGCSWDGEAVIWDALSGSPFQHLKPRSVEVTAAGLSAGGDYALVGGKDFSLRFLGLKSGWQQYVYQQHLSWPTVRFSPDNRFFASASLDNTVKATKLGDSRPFLVFSEKQGQGITHLCFWPDGRKLAYLVGDSLKVRELQTGKLWLRRPLGLQGRPSALDISARDSSILVAVDSLIIVWHSDGSEAFRRQAHDLFITAACYSPDGRYFLTASADGALKLWEARSGRLVQQFKNGGPVTPVTAAVFAGDSRRILSAADNGRLSLWEIGRDKPLKAVQGHGRRINGLQANTELALSYGEGSGMKIWRLPELKEVAACHLLDGGRFLTLLPSGYYACSNSRALLDELGLAGEQAAYPLSLLDVQYNRPDLVAAAMVHPDTLMIPAYRSAYQERLFQMGMEEAALSGGFHLPEAGLADKENLPLLTRQSSATLGLWAVDSLYGLRSVTVYNFGVPQFTQLFPDSLKTLRWEGDVSLPLAPGENEIQVRAVNGKKVASLPDWIKINYKGKEKRPKLYLLSIGVSRYKYEKFSLRYAAKGAAEIAALLASGAAFDTVYSQVLLDEDFTAESLEEALARFQSATINDIVIVYYAGNGRLDMDKLEYYLTTTASDIGKPDGDIPFRRLENALGQLPALHKLLLLDTGQSGDIDTRIRNRAAPGGASGSVSGLINPYYLMKELFVNLSDNLGLSVLAAAGGMENALEGEEWNNSVFAYALLQGLAEGKADANGDGLVTALELEKYIALTVSEETGGLQRPAWRGSPPRLDFPLWK